MISGVKEVTSVQSNIILPNESSLKKNRTNNMSFHQGIFLVCWRLSATKRATSVIIISLALINMITLLLSEIFSIKLKLHHIDNCEIENSSEDCHKNS